MSNFETIRSREEIPQEDTWALEDLYVSDEAWENALNALLARLPEVSKLEGTLSESAQTLLAFLTLL